MKGWEMFWTAWLVISGASFAVITAIVTVLGVRDLKSMFRLLQREPEDE